MVRLLIMLLAVAGGIAQSTQASINGALGKKIGSFEGAFFSFFIGMISLLLITFFFGKGNLLNVFQVPKWQLFGGLLGAAFVAIQVFAVPKVGAGATIISIIAGQIIMSLIADQFGLFGNPKIALHGTRLVGVLLLIVALFLIFKGGAKA